VVTEGFASYKSQALKRAATGAQVRGSREIERDLCTKRDRAQGLLHISDLSVYTARVTEL
jgi:hypothetical protein